MTLRVLLICGVAWLPAPAIAQTTEHSAPADPVAAPDAAAQPSDDAAAEAPLDDELYGDDEAIVVVGSKARGSAIGNIPPEQTLDSRDVRATGATTIGELLEAVSAQTTSTRGRGGRPVILVNGMRTASFREVHDIPPEAIERMEILPEEVALKYGYGADQKVVNLVLRRRFNSKNAEAGMRIATDGGYSGGTLRGSRFLVRDNRRTTFGVEIEGNSALTEDERDLVLQPIETADGSIDPREFRTLVGSARSARGTAVLATPIGETTGATLTGELEVRRGRSLFGVPVETLEIPVGNPFFPATGDSVVRAFEDFGPLVRKTRSVSAGTSANLNGTLTGSWRWSAIANAELERSRSSADRGPDLTGVQNAIDALNPALDPAGDLGPLTEYGRDRATSVRRLFSGDSTFSGPFFEAPAGPATAVVKIGASAVALDSDSFRRGVEVDSNLDRTRGDAGVDVDLPLSPRDDRIGRLTANANAAKATLSDFGTLTTLGAGLNWSPTAKLSAIASWTREDGAPTIQQLGDPILETPGVQFFDFVRGETALVTTLSGGNRALDADRRNVVKLGLNWQLPTKADVRLRTEFTRSTTDSPIGSLPAASPELEAAFPDRFVRDDDGRLVAVDLRPVNYRAARSSSFTWGLQFSKPLTATPPSPDTIDAMRERMRRMLQRQGITMPAGPPGGSGGAAPVDPHAPPPGGGAPAVAPSDEMMVLHGVPPSGGPPPAGAGTGPPAGAGMGMRRGGGMRGFGGGRGGRLTFGLTHTIALDDEVDLGEGLARVDYLDGAAYGPSGGKPRHTVELEGGYYKDGLGIRADLDWRSATRVDSVAGPIKFSSYADLNLRLFANLGEQIGLVAKHPFFMGSSVRFEINNVFNARPKVRDAFGEVPLTYQAAQLEPIGRTVGISFRKLFIPLRFARFGTGTEQRRPGG